MDSQNLKYLEQAKVLLNDLIEEQKRIDAREKALMGFIAELGGLQVPEDRFVGKNFMAHHLDLLQEQLKKIEKVAKS